MIAIRIIVALIFLFIAIISFPVTAVAKYGKKNRKLTLVFAGIGSLSTILFIILIWPYIPD